ncbi:MAG: hypothetical protein ACE15C_03005 [Phycisphaerae bacterium]
MTQRIAINRAPVLTLWAAVVAERLGFDADAALTLGKCLAGLNAQSKGRSLGIFGKPKVEHSPPKKAGRGEDFRVEICGRPVPAKNIAAGVRAVVEDKPIDPSAVQKYLQQKFGEDLAAVRDAMKALAASVTADDLRQRAYGLYEQFRPKIPPGARGWGAKGDLDLDFIRSLAGRK